MFYKSYIVNVCVNFLQLIFTCFNDGNTLYRMQLISQCMFYKSYIVKFCGNFTQLIFNCFNNGYTLSLESTIYAAGDSSYSVLASYAVKCFVQPMNANHLQAWLRKFHVVVFDYLYVIVILWFTMHFNWIYSACFTILWFTLFPSVKSLF